jgi:hypothetical protein
MSEPRTSIAVRDEGHKPGEPWFPDSFYSMHGDSGVIELAENTALPPAMRLQWLCIATANRWGHAAFGPGKLKQALKIERATLNRAIGTLIAGKIAAPESNSRCIVLSAFFYGCGSSGVRWCSAF